MILVKTNGWVSAKEGVPFVNTPFLIKQGTEVEYAWRRASDGKIEVKGYNREYLLDDDYNGYEWQYLPK